MPLLHRLTTTLLKSSNLKPSAITAAAVLRRLSSKTGDDEWNDVWETAWLPEDLSDKSPRKAWESDVAFSLPNDTTQSASPEEMDPETTAFVEDMNDNWEQRKGKSVKREPANSSSESMYSLENIKRDYRLKKQRIHTGLWAKEIEKMEEGKLGNLVGVDGDDFEKLLDSASEIFDSPNTEFGDSKDSISELKNKPDGWETTSKTPDGNIWDMSQREEDILVQEFERRISYNKFQIASFIKTHIFSRRRPIDGWKYMIEVIGPNARKGKGSVTRLPSVSDESTQPFREEKPPTHPRTR